MTARIADASRTMSLISSGLPAFRDQFVRQRGSRLQISFGTLPSSLKTAPLRRDPQFVIFNQQYDLVADFDTESLTKLRRNDDSAVLVNSRSCFLWHDRASLHVTMIQ